VKFEGRKFGSPAIISVNGLKDAESAHRKGIRVIIP